jgi:hypothetical protein
MLQLSAFGVDTSRWLYAPINGQSPSSKHSRILKEGLFLIPLLLTIVDLLGVLGIQLSTPIADALTFILSLPLGIRALRMDLAEPKMQRR